MRRARGVLKQAASAFFSSPMVLRSACGPPAHRLSSLLAPSPRARPLHVPRVASRLEWIAPDGLQRPLEESGAERDGWWGGASGEGQSPNDSGDGLAGVQTVTTCEEARAAVAVLMERTGVYHAVDTEVANVDVIKETPVGHGEIICFSVYCGKETDFGGGRSRLWVDVLRGGQAVLEVFREYLESEHIQKVWHNYSFDKHIFQNHGITPGGFGGDTMHMARLWDSSRTGKGYSLEALTHDAEVMNDASDDDGLGFRAKLSMKKRFGKPNQKKDGTDGKLSVLPELKALQESPETRAEWIDYSTLDTEATWLLRESLECKLRNMPADASQYVNVDADFPPCATMWEFYEQYWKPFGNILAGMESAGMRVDNRQLEEAEKLALTEQAAAERRFMAWASARCEDARWMNVGSGAQIRQLLFAGLRAGKVQVPETREFKVPNPEWAEWDAGGRAGPAPKRQRVITLHGISPHPIEPKDFTASGLPSVSSLILRNFVGGAGRATQLLERHDEILAQQPAGEARDTQLAAVQEQGAKLCGDCLAAFGGGREGLQAASAIDALCEAGAINTLLSGFILPLQGSNLRGREGRVHCSLNINTETGRLSARRPNLQNQPALEKDRYGIRKAFIAEPGRLLIVADYGQLELRLLAHMANCASMLRAFELGGDFHSRTALGMYPHIREAIDRGECLLEWEGEESEAPTDKLLKNKFSSERRKAKILNFSIAYGKTKHGLSRDWRVSLQEAERTVEAWYRDRPEVKRWQEEQHALVKKRGWVTTLLGRQRQLPEASSPSSSNAAKAHALRAAINTPIQGGAADIAMLAMLELDKCATLKRLGWRLLMQVHDEVILEGPAESSQEALTAVRLAMQQPFRGRNLLRCTLEVSSSIAASWYEGK